MFRQIAPKGIVNKTIVTPGTVQKEDISAEPLDRESLSESSGNGQQNIEALQDNVTPGILSDDSNSSEGKDMVTATGGATEGLVAAEKDANLTTGAAVVAPEDSEAVAQVHAEMSSISVSECPFLNRE
jgi:hypothetical protein